MSREQSRRDKTDASTPEDVLAAFTDTPAGPAGLAEKRRIEEERADAARRLAAARRQIAEADSGGSTVDSDYAEPPEPPEPPEPERPQRPSTAEDHGRRAGSKTSRHAEERVRSTFSTNTDFVPRRGVRRVLALVLIAMLVACAYAAWALVEERNVFTVGVAFTVFAATLTVWAVRVNTPLITVSVRSGVLIIKRGGEKQVFDVSGRHTPIRIDGRPGRRGWRVLLLRTDGLPFEVNSSMVDPHHFTEILLAMRPDLADSHAED